MTVTQRERAELGEPNADFTATGLMRLWTQRDDLMPMTSAPGSGRDLGRPGPVPV